MKIQDIPQVGKLGLTVTWHGRNGQIRRILVTPKNPRTDRQLEVRELLVQQARAFDALTDAQQDAWNVAADGFKSRASRQAPVCPSQHDGGWVRELASAVPGPSANCLIVSEPLPLTRPKGHPLPLVGGEG